MSEELIRRSDAIDALRKPGHEVVVIDKVCSLGVAHEFIDAIRDIPSADRPQGEWIDEHEDGRGSWVGTCNQCGKENHVDNFCPNCGARMKGADNE